MSHTLLDGSDDVFDSRDVLELIADLENREAELRYAWHDFEQDESTDQIADKEILTITDDGEEMAVIVHRNVPTLDNERMKDAKRESAQLIVDALNAYGKEAKTLEALRSLRDDFDARDFEDGMTFIADRYFTEYVEELVSEIGDLPREVPGYIVIDWDATADNIRQDYADVEFFGTTYWVRA